MQEQQLCHFWSSLGLKLLDSDPELIFELKIPQKH